MASVLLLCLVLIGPSARTYLFFSGLRKSNSEISVDMDVRCGLVVELRGS